MGSRVASQTREFERLIREHARLMAAAIRRVCGRRHGALVPDVEQEVHLALWKRLQAGNEIAHPTSYLYKMALTTALAMVRKLRPELDVEAAEAVAVGGHQAFDLEPVERSHLLAEALATLEADEARALRAYLAGFNHKEVARLYGWTESVARHRIYRSMEALRQRMNRREA